MDTPDHALQASYHHLVLGVARHSLASGFHPGQASLSLFEAKGNGSRPCLSSPVWILTLVVVTSLPDDDLLGSLALDPRTPGSAPRARGLRSPA